MPQYKWTGVNLSAQFQKGTLYARSIAELDAQLLNRSIALTRARPMRSFRHRKCTSNEVAQFYASMATLLHAGLKVPEALDVVVHTASRPEVSQLYDSLFQEVLQGARLADACGKNTRLADAPSLAMMVAGESSGTLSAALNANYHRLHAMYEFKSLTRTALLMPLITCSAFVVLLLFVFLWLIPLMQPFIVSAVHELPMSTRVMIRISDMLRHPASLLSALCALSVMSVGVWFGLKSKQIKSRFERFLLALPFFGTLLVVRERAIVFDVIKLLHMQGIEMLHMLSIAHAATAQSVMADEFAHIRMAVSGGAFFSHACARTKHWYDPEIAGLLLVGERSGTLHDALDRIVRLQRTELARKLKIISIVAQPLIIALLGGIIALVVVSIYLPLLQMPNIISA